MRTRFARRTVAAATAGLAAVAGLVALSPGAQAGTVTPTVSCELPAGQGTFAGPQDVTVTLDKATVPAGGQLTGSVTLGVSPAKTPLTMRIYATPSITLGMKGAATGEVTVTGTEQVIDTVKDQPVPIAPYSGKFNIPVAAIAGGKIEFTVLRMLTNTTLSPGGAIFPTVCTVVAGGDAVVADVNVDAGTGDQATLDAPDGDVYPGQPIGLSGTKFTPNGAVQAQLCNGDGTGCSTTGIPANTLSVNGDGVLSGTATLAPETTEGAHVIKVTGGEKEAQDGITVKPFVVPGQRKATASVTSGRLGTVVHIVGENFTPNVNVNVSQLDSDGFDLLPFVNLNADYQGKFAVDFTVDSPWIASLRVREGTWDDRAVILPFTLIRDARSLSLDKVTGPLGTTVVVSGANWTPNTTIIVVQTDELGLDGSGSIAVTSDAQGAFSTPYTVTDSYTTQIRAIEGMDESTQVYTPFTVTQGPLPLSQGISVTLNPGSLTMSQAGTGIDFGSATMNGEAQTLNANLNQVTVLDTRGGNLGWSLTGTMSDLTAANGTDKFPAGSVSWTPSCVASQASISTVTNGTPGALGSTPATLCSVAATGATTGGSFAADAQLKLTTPQFAAAGSYTATLTLTLS